jgi:hypothetical protein
LESAASRGYKEIVEMLLNKDTKANRSSRGGGYSIFYAGGSDKEEIADMLYKSTIDLYVKSDK